MTRVAGSTPQRRPSAARCAVRWRPKGWRPSFLVTAVALCFLAAGRADAGYAEGMEAFARGDYETAYEELRPLAEKGEAGAQFTLGFMYDYGQGVPQNTQEAIWWYRNAAEKDIAVAQFSLGEIFERGRGTPQDFVSAFRWYSLAAKNLPPGEIRDSVVERREVVAARLTPEQKAIAALLLDLPAASPADAAEEAGQAEPPSTRGGEETAQAADAALVAAIQHELARLGYEASWREGVLDSATRGAIQAFEIETGREVTGMANEALLSALRAAAGGPPLAGTSRAPEDSGAPGTAARSRSLALASAAAAEPPPDAAARPAASDGGAAPRAAESAPSNEIRAPSGPAGGPLIPLEEQAAAPHEQQAALPDGHGRRPEAVGQNRRTSPWDLRFVERQIARLDEIVERVDGPSAAMPGWDALEAWESRTRGLLAARLGQEAASRLSAEREAPILGDPLGNFQRTAAGFRDYLSAILEAAIASAQPPGRGD